MKMGYDTNYEGVLKLPEDMSIIQLGYLKTILGEDFRDHPEWHHLLPKNTYLTYIDLVLTEDLMGVKWDDRTEKTHSMVEAVNLITALIRTKLNNKFKFTGKFLCQGEDIEDRWFLMIDDAGIAFREDIATDTIITCPDCGCRFELGS
jgi:hypothetical protein